LLTEALFMRGVSPQAPALLSLKAGWAMVGRTISHYQILEKLEFAPFACSLWRKNPPT
jgi:hypothetical protein